MAAHLWILVASPVSTCRSSVGTFPWKPLGEFPLQNQQLQSRVREPELVSLSSPS